MTVDVNDRLSGPHLGNGATVAFAYDFKIDANTELRVILRSSAGVDTTKTLTTHYTVSGVGDAGGGNVTFVTAPATGEKVIIEGVKPKTQTVNYTENERFPYDAHQGGMDKNTRVDQELQRDVDRSLKFPHGETVYRLPVKPSSTMGLGQTSDGEIVHLEAGDFDVDVLLGSGQADALGRDLVDMVFTTRTVAAAASIATVVQRIRVMGYATIFDGGGAVYKRISTPSPVRAWHFASADGAYWQIDERIWFPEMIGAVGDGVAGADGVGVTGTDDTTALQNYNLAWERWDSLDIIEAHFRPGAVYWCLPEGSTDDSIIFDLDNPKGLKIVGNGATISVRSSEDDKTFYCFLIDGAEKCSIKGLKLEQPNLAGMEGAGVRWVLGRIGFNDNDIELETVNGETAIQITRVVGSGTARSSNNRFRVRSSGTYKPIALQSDGDGTDLVLTCDNFARAVIFYNMNGLTARIIGSNPHTHTTIAATCYGNDSASDLDVKETTGFDIHYTEKHSTTWTDEPLWFYCSHQQIDATGSFPTRIAGRIGLDLSANGATEDQWREGLINVSWVWNVAGVSQQLGEPSGGNTEDIEVYGYYDGDLDDVGSDNGIDLGSTSYGFDDESVCNWTFKNFNAPNLTRPMNFGRVMKVDFQNCDLTQATRTFEASFSPPNFTYRNSSFSGIARSDSPSIGAWRVLAASVVAVSHTGDTNTTTLATVSLPANSLGPNGAIRITTQWSHTNSGNSKTLRVYFGGTGGTQYLNNTVSTTATTRDQRVIHNLNATNSQKGGVAGNLTTGGWGVTTGATLVTSALDTTAAQDIVIRATLADSGETVTLEGYIIEVVYLA